MRIEPDDAGQRVDRFVRKLLPSATLGHCFKLLRKGRVRVNGAKVKPAYRLVVGDEVLLRVGDEQASDLTRKRTVRRTARPVDASALVLLHQDDHVVAVDKPPFVLVQPGDDPDEPTLQDLVRARLGASGALTFEPSLAHRLDRGTSGIVLIGASAAGLRGLTAAFRTRIVDKRYLALVAGEPTEDTFTVDQPLARDPSDERRGKRVKVSRGAGAQVAETRFRVLGRNPADGFALIEARPITGRTHQIRAHLRYAKLPIVGDPTYGVPRSNAAWKDTPGIWRQFLHAYRIRLAHPVDAEQALDVICPLPEDLSRALAWAGLASALPGGM